MSSVRQMDREVAELQTQCRRRWGIEVVMPEGGSQRLAATGLHPRDMTMDIAELMAFSAYDEKVLEIDVRECEDGPIPAAAVSMSWVKYAV